MALDIQQIREDFPILHQKIYNKPLIYLDNAASTQKPSIVIDSISSYYKTINSNIHRGVHYLSQRATDAFEEARTSVANFIHAAHPYEVIFTRGTTESINLVAFSFGEAFIKEGDEILISTLEHHSNIVPWQLLCERKKAVLKVIPINDEGEIIFDSFLDLLSPKTKLVSITHISNALGTVNPIKNIIDAAHAKNIPVLIDAAQSIAHTPINVQTLDCDFLCFSGHKMYGPTGIGVLYGKEKWLTQMPPYQGGGEMISTVSFEKTLYNELPFKFEAGTPNICGPIALKIAIDYIQHYGLEQIAAYENELLSYAQEQLATIEGIKFYGMANQKAGAISFLINDIHAFDLGSIIDKYGIAVRTGHHCVQPLMQRLGIAGTVRASFAMYNTKKEIDVFIDAVKKAKQMLS